MPVQGEGCTEGAGLHVYGALSRSRVPMCAVESDILHYPGGQRPGHCRCLRPMQPGHLLGTGHALAVGGTLAVVWPRNSGVLADDEERGMDQTRADCPAS